MSAHFNRGRPRRCSCLWHGALWQRISPDLFGAASEKKRILSLGSIFQMGLEDVTGRKVVRASRS